MSAVAAFLLGACSSRPADVVDGTYRAMAASGELAAAPDASLTVVNGQFTFTTPAGADIVATTSPGTDEFVVCPPDTEGTPDLLGGSLTLGDTTLAQPAVIGDCGHTKPVRITIVDLASVSADSVPFPFTRWIEFCDTADPDC
jgi:hypothetical protein